MKISIQNFKSIQNIDRFRLKPITVLSGVNSSGKSSLIQCLLMIKQTVELDSSKHQLQIKGNLFSVREYRDLLTGKLEENEFGFTLEFTKSELAIVKNRPPTLFDSFDDYKCSLKAIYGHHKHRPYIHQLTISYHLPNGNKNEQYVKFIVDLEKSKYEIEANSEYFGEGLWSNPPLVQNIQFSSIFPSYYVTKRSELVESTLKDEPPGIEETIKKEYPKVDDIKFMIDHYFENLSYIGPLREAPRDEYLIRGEPDSVGDKGQHVAFILKEYSALKTSYYKITETGEEITYTKHDATLLEAVKYWVCDVFQFAKDIFSKPVGESYEIILVDQSGLETTIRHVGFGVSQLLPVIVQGLIMNEGGTLVLEQPEIHLHPKIQSWLFDFIHTLALSNRNVLIETHSDHFITRMRRRIAEDSSAKLQDEISLTFIENDSGKNVYRTLNLDDLGTLEYFPKDFIEQAGSELKAIVKAQMRKRKSSKL